MNLDEYAEDMQRQSETATAMAVARQPKPRRATPIGYAVQSYDVALRVRVRVQDVTSANDLANLIEAALRANQGVTLAVVDGVIPADN